ncbi:hypothetical protein C5C56_13725 [Rathayibacter sp. AY1D1]|uniref:hypothetical protein n=1 Tax=Rathayibacter sp. AY1D1 TaxID=2080542 RepID=UPI000CE7B61F|nr:hypothetical protein [Rathayibacter sp. AY1D1]PPH96806.1 hypothetical protein C5C56_13725 [Rathayibacter sp. AY1D1]
MSSDTEYSPRDAELRRMLVASATAPQPAPRKRGALLGLLGAFVAAGALTGGAVSAAALNGGDQTTTVSIEEMTEQVVYDDAQLFGTPFVLSGAGNTVVELGAIPEGAEQIAVAFHCVDPGSFVINVDGQPYTQGCGRQATTGANGGAYFSPGAAGDHSISVTTGRDTRYLLWASWATPAAAPEASAEQQAALEDGTVTEDEYRAGFTRYAACMLAADYPLSIIDESGPIIDYTNNVDAVTSGVEGSCYAKEFGQLDMGWQIQQEPQGDQ